MAPLAGKPPYATDEPDSFYESSPAPQRRVRQQPPADPNKRTSAYDMYDNYLEDDKAASRQSGIGALGMGLMNMDDSDDDDEDDTDARRKLQPSPTSKHAALAAATAAANSQRNHSPIPPPQPIAAPQPGYAAPIAALNLARPQPTAESQGRQQVQQQTLRINPARDLNNPFNSPADYLHSPHQHPTSPYPTSPYPTSPSPSEPHPLQPPVTPITPVFARPAKAPGIKFSETAVPRDPSKPIMRGNSEETLLPSRGEKGDDFWRRFSMVAKEENKKPSAQKQSVWLRETQNGSTRLSRWVWVIGVVILLCIGGAIGLGWYFSHNAPAHQQPTVFGGSANEAAVPVSSSTKASAGPGGSTVMHVSPTHTVARRIAEARVTPVSGFSAAHKRRAH